VNERPGTALIAHSAHRVSIGTACGLRGLGWLGRFWWSHPAAGFLNNGFALPEVIEQACKADLEFLHHPAMLGLKLTGQQLLQGVDVVAQFV